MSAKEHARILRKKLDAMSDGERLSIFKVFYHHKKVTPEMVGQITGVIVETAPGEEPFDIPYPAPEEWEFARKIVEELLSFHEEAQMEHLRSYGFAV